ncbi:MAG TPA: beta-xylosidase [Lacunisphaera sp.]|nr:beta-xylosidase [Lacunisphaera sp.]
MKLPQALLLAAFAASGSIHAADTPASFPVTITVDAAKPMGPLRPIWRFFGADEPNYATMKDGRRLVKDLGQLSQLSTAKPQVYFRAHNLLCTGDGTPAFKWGSTNAYTEDAAGNPVYNWTIVDHIFDTYLARGVKPYAQIGFMPQALSPHPEPYQHEWRPGLPYNEIYTGWAYPPKDYKKWEELVYQWVKHCVERYGRAEVESWYWEVWNEANIGYWKGTPEEFRKTHDYAIAGVRRALPTARVGGPDSAGHGGEWMHDFIEHCLRGTNFATGQKGTPLDFISFHAKGQPTFVDGHIRMGISTHLKGIDGGFQIVASYPETKNTPIIIGESDPEGCAACQGPNFSYRNGTVYSSYTAASFARKLDLADKHGVNFEGALTWAFTFENQPYFAGFRQLASNGLPLAVLNVFRMMGRMEGDRLTAASSSQVPLEAILKDGVRGAPDVGVLAARMDKRMTIMVWHYHDDDVPGPSADVALGISGLPTGVTAVQLKHYRVDETHSNPFGDWKRMGSPLAPSRPQYDQLTAASNLATLADAPATIAVAGGKAELKFPLPRQGVSLLELSWE